MLSWICLPIFFSGFRLVIGSCITIEIFLPRTPSQSFSVNLVMSRPSYMMLPPVILPLTSSIPTKVLVNTLLPEPDSPTMASVSPSYRSSEHLRMAFRVRPRRLNWISTSRAEMIAFLSMFYLSLNVIARVRCVRESVAHDIECNRNDGHDGRGEDQQVRVIQEEAAHLRQQQAQRRRVDAQAQAQVRQRRFQVDGGGDALRHAQDDDRHQVGQDVLG